MTEQEKIDFLKTLMVRNEDELVEGERYLIINILLKKASSRGFGVYSLVLVEKNVLMQGSDWAWRNQVSGAPYRIFKYNKEAFEFAWELFGKMLWGDGSEKFWALIEGSGQFSCKLSFLNDIDEKHHQFSGIKR
ncbi:hypothetical protein ACFL08_00605 [Patescibacteria group bacterium]